MTNLKRTTVLAIVITVLLAPTIYAASSRAGASALGNGSATASSSATASGSGSATASSSATASGSGSATASSSATASGSGSATSVSGTIATDGHTADARTSAVSTGDNVKSECVVKNDVCTQSKGGPNGESNGESATTGGSTTTGGTTTTSRYIATTTTGGHTKTTSESGTKISSKGNIIRDTSAGISYTPGGMSSGYSSHDPDKQIITKNNDGTVIAVSGKSDVLVPVQEKFKKFKKSDNEILDNEDIANIPKDTKQTGIVAWIFSLLDIV